MTGSVSKAPWLLARFAQAAIGVAAVADMFRVVTLRAQHLHPTDASLRSRFGFASMVFVYLMTAAVVLFLVWFSRCRRNAHALSAGALGHGAGGGSAGTGSPRPGAHGADADAGDGSVWAVVAWLIPVVNLWVPRGLVLEVQRASSAEAAERGREDVLVNAWWAAWVGHAVIVLGSRFGQGTSMPLLVLSEAFNVVAAVLAMCVIQRITALQSAALPAMSPAGPLSHA
ncbi:DUF4328 domain-containing protein [Streptomyces sp. R21]|uniref:DUF4328 domain-containing protein n=1 Tax=Streptomyces sp. R21 TaxID=3238627 RepID=A0AB39PQ05_9ACTN